MISFPEYIYRQYPYSFIKGVSLFINYTPDPKMAENLKETNLKFKDYLFRIFSVQFKEDFVPDVWNANIFKNGKSQRITFLKNYIIVSLDFNAYENFTQSVVPVLCQLQYFFEEIMHVTDYPYIGLTKVNGWGLTPDEGEEFNIKTAREIILSNDLIDKSSESTSLLPESDYPLLMFKEKFEAPDGKAVDVRITSICEKPVEGEKDYNLDMAIAMEMEMEDTKNFKKLEEQFYYLNRLQYDAFHWAISRDIIRIMEGEFK